MNINLLLPKYIIRASPIKATRKIFWMGTICLWVTLTLAVVKIQQPKINKKNRCNFLFCIRNWEPLWKQEWRSSQSSTMNMSTMRKSISLKSWDWNWKRHFNKNQICQMRVRWSWDKVWSNKEAPVSPNRSEALMQSLKRKINTQIMIWHMDKK